MHRAEAQQQEVIAALDAAGLTDLSVRVQCCMDGRIARRSEESPAWPRQCRVHAACHACRRTAVGHWWRSCIAACNGDRVIRLTIPVRHEAGDVALAVRRLTRRLRWWREQQGRWYRDVAMSGIVLGEVAHVLLTHPGLTASEVVYALRCWPSVTVVDDAEAMPDDDLCVADIVALAAARRGIEPLRFWVGPVQRFRADGNALLRLNAETLLEPMPIAFG